MTRQVEWYIAFCQQVKNVAGVIIRFHALFDALPHHRLDFIQIELFFEQDHCLVQTLDFLQVFLDYPDKDRVLIFGWIINLERSLLLEEVQQDVCQLPVSCHLDFVQ